MSVPNSSTTIRAPGRLIVGPTNLSLPESNYGGEELGKTRAVAIVPLGVPFLVECEGLGEASDVLEGNNRYLLNGFFRGMDKDAVENLLAGGYAEGTTTHHPVWSEPGARTPGQSASSRGKIFLFVPDDTVHAPAALIYNGIPDFASGAELAFQRGEEFGIEVSIECLRDGSGRILSVGRLEDLSL